MKRLCTLIHEIVPRFEYKAPEIMTGHLLVYASDAEVIASDLSSILPSVDFTKYLLLVHIDPEQYIIPDKHNYHIVIHDIICRYFGITSHEIRERDRHRDTHVVPRQLAYHFTYKFCRGVKSLVKIGEYYGGYDHATVLHGSRVIQNFLDIGDAIITDHYVNIYALITNKIKSDEQNQSTDIESLVA